MTPPHSQLTRDLASRLMGGEADASAEPDALAASASQVCEGVLEHLSRWVGIDGAAALFARALTHAQDEHPALRGVRYAPRSSSCLSGIADAARAHGTIVVSRGVAGILVALIELLGRLIGEDMAVRLVEQSVRPVAPGDASSPGGEIER